jgi:Fe-S-cluster-containing hydrogenase component 2
VVAVKATPTPKDLEVLLELRLDEVHTPHIPLGLSGDISEKQVTERAVVCDLCSAQYGQRPACVTACPHDAAMRVNARFEFPVG